jgi:hypothetical protein
MAAAGKKSSGAVRALRALVVALALLSIAAAALLGGTVGWLLTLLLLPLGFGVMVERVARRWQRQARAERVMLYAVPSFAAASTAVALFALRGVTADAFAAIERPGWLGDRGRDIGALLGGEREAAGASPAPAARDERGRKNRAAPARTSAAPVPSPSAPAAPPPSGPPRFSAGDGSYREAESCATLTDLSDVASAHRPERLRASAEEVAKRRYPTGVAFLQAQDDVMLKAWFSHGGDTFDGLISRLEVAIHEGSHIWSAKRLNGRTATYRVNDALTVELRWLDTFHRSETSPTISTPPPTAT